MKANVESLIQYEIKKGVISKRDYTYVKNQLYYLLNLDLSMDKIDYIKIDHPSEALKPILDQLVSDNVIEDFKTNRDLFDAKIMNIFASLPSVVENKFHLIKKTSSKDATNFLYNYAKSLNYIRFDRILKNISFDYKTKNIQLQITINLSKPEKDPKEIIAQAKAIQSNYPPCVLCKENEGFSGNMNRDSRDQHRLLELNIENKKWYFQYSPYIYYNEHAIVLSEKHEPMRISKDTFINLLSLVDQFDSYFFGSNADLPIVGGSILSHEHYQGGRHKFPIEDAKSIYELKYGDVNVNLLNWPLSTIRLKSTNKANMIHLSTKILESWKTYSNPELNIYSNTLHTPHNTITPIARFKNGLYELDLVLRNNRTTDMYPNGIFHPHEDKHHIKKENIGLIEAIGLAILPARLVEEIYDLRNYYFNHIPLPEKSMVHKTWFDSLLKKYEFTQNNFDEIIKFEIGKVFENVLIDCGVFKKKDYDAFIKFINGVKL
ncbi:UDP-glucose--hexose-1-phosphate uridylyltransferase [Acholeplasma granularum]|uniref:UDP-glucose--hexose-1-phosphate uridylyltransferase n=1 Tax=Acholeplasma granularum TaxID=264635 RepID=UPI0004BA9963|nr:UDP-glucose--hexose-1-phosphate uridylyltransferase [Acholeplasma granularum]